MILCTLPAGSHLTTRVASVPSCEAFLSPRRGGRGRGWVRPGGEPYGSKGDGEHGDTITRHKASKNNPPGAPGAGRAAQGGRVARPPPARSAPGAAPAFGVSEKLGRKLDAVPDRVDIRDWWYQPALVPLPDEIINIDRVPAILDQGREGACTGYALAGVVNYLLHGRNVDRRVSPRMLYEMARHYDEWPGERYEGSSARGALKGWLRHGVTVESRWPATARKTVAVTRPRQGSDEDARRARSSASCTSRCATCTRR